MTTFIDPEIMLLDEPTTALDLVAKERLMNYFQSFVGGGGAISLVTHDTQELEYCTRCHLLSEGALSLCDSKDRHILVKMLDKYEK